SVFDACFQIVTALADGEVVHKLMDGVEIVAIAKVAISANQSSRNSSFERRKLAVSVRGHTVLAYAKRVKIEISICAGIAEHIVRFVQAVAEFVECGRPKNMQVLDGDIVGARGGGRREVRV